MSHDGGSGRTRPQIHRSQKTVVCGEASGSAREYCVVVPVANPANVGQLTWMACQLVAPYGGRIRVVSVVDLPDQTPLEAGRDVDQKHRAVVDRALETARERDVPAVGETPVSHDPVCAILDAVEDSDADAVLLGWGRGRSNSVVARLRERVDCDVFVERIGPRATEAVESILVPTAGGPHATLAVETAGAIADEIGASLELLAVVPATAPAERLATARDRLREVRGRLVPDAVDLRVLERDDTARAIVEASGDHDLTVLGASERGGVSGLLAGNLPRAVARRAPGTVLVAQRGDLEVPTRVQRLFDLLPGSQP